MKKVTRKKYESANSIPEVIKITSDKTGEQDCISKLRNIRINNVSNVILGTLNINSIASNFDGFKLVVTGIFDILIITETKLNDTFPTSQFYNVI